MRLTIKGEVWQPIQVTPRSAAFGRITATSASEGMERKLTIVNNIGGEVNFTNIQSSNPGFRAEVKPLESGKKYELIVTLVPPLTSGNNTGKITMKTGLKDPSTFDVPVYAFVTSPVDVTPTQLTIMPNQTAELKRQFYIRGNDGKEFEVNDLKCTTDKIAMELTDVRGNKQTYRLSIDIPADYTPSAAGDKITFTTTHPDVPTLEIPIVGRGAADGSRIRPTDRPVKRPAAKFTGKGMVPPNKRKATITNSDDTKKEGDAEKEKKADDTPKKPEPMKPVG